MAKAAGTGDKSAWQGLALGMVLVGAPSLLLLLAVLLAPCLICIASDRSAGRMVARASLLAALSFCVSPLWQLWLSGLGIAHAFALLTHRQIVAWAWCGGAAGWLAAEFAPLGAQLIMNARALRREQKLAGMRAKLIEEWNLDE